jgi:hypothetical protein
MINRLPKRFQVSSSNGARIAEPFGEERPRNLVDKAGRCIGRHSVVVLGAAFVIGLVLGRIVKR